jgi:plasmid stabilization system protein ParE
MSRDLAYLPEVSRDFVEAVSYYEALSPQAALRFEEAFARAEAEVAEGLVTHLRVFDHYHRVFIGRFPYNLYYRLHASRAVIVGMLYARYSPQRIEDALEKRKGEARPKEARAKGSGR